MSRRTYHTQKQLTEQVLSQMTDAQWQEVIDLLPADASQQAFLHHAFSRARGLSEKGARSWARRTRQSSDWLLWMVQSLLVSPAEEESLDIPRSFTGEIHLVDATHLRTWKRSGDSRLLSPPGHHRSGECRHRRAHALALVQYAPLASGWHDGV